MTNIFYSLQNNQLKETKHRKQFCYPSKWKQKEQQQIISNKKATLEMYQY